MNYPVNEHLFLEIQEKLICTACHALILYDIAWKYHEYQQIPIERAVELIIQYHTRNA